MSNSKSFYDIFAERYDAFNSNRSNTLAMVHYALKQAEITQGRLLELGCGTGKILEPLAASFEVTGLDNSPAMLKKAALLLGKRATLIEGDMQNFSIDAPFDAIIAVFDSINHLATFAEWEHTFRTVHRHLRPGGCFIFDINTPGKVAHLAEISPLTIYHEPEMSVILNVRPITPHHSEWHFTLFQKMAQDHYQKYEEKLSESIFAPEKILTSLKALFATVTLFDPEDVLPQASLEQRGKLYFMCQK